MIPHFLTVCFLSCSFLVIISSAAPQPDPQRSVQLGGAGPRPVALSPTVQGGSIYSQQLAFGPPQTQILQSPTPSSIPQGARIRVPHQGLQTQALFSSIPSNQGRPFSIQPFPGAVRPQQPIVLKSPGGAQQEDEEYEEDEYDEEPASPSPRPQPTPTPRPIPQRGGSQRINPQSILLSQQQPGPGPQRFVIPQQASPQPTPQQIRRPVQRVPVQQQQQTPQAVSSIRQPVSQSRPSLGSDSRLKNRASTPPPIQTINRFMRNNPDGSITWGYENEDGTFKEETLGADCVVRGKYGYIDPDGNKREYEYQQGNPCDPNKRDEPEEEEEIAGPSSQQKLGGLLTARPGQIQQRRPVQVYQQ